MGTEKNGVGMDPVISLLDKIPKLTRTFEIHRKIGEGTFSSVYLASLHRESKVSDDEKRWFAIKHLVPTTHPTRAAHELRCLREIGGKNNVIGVVECMRDMDHVVFIMPYIKHNKFSEYVGDMGADELRRYLRALLTALQHVHSFGVIHRDVKPSNFLYDRERGRFALVDFGLAQHTAAPLQPPPAHQKRPRDEESLLPSAKRGALDVTGAPRPYTPLPAHTRRRILVSSDEPGNHMDIETARIRARCGCSGVGGVCPVCVEWPPPRANRAGTQGFRPPEVFFKYQHQTTSVDMWAAGVILVSLLTGRYPFFEPEDDMSALAEIVSLCGTKAIQDTGAALGCRLVLSLNVRGTCLRKLCAHLRRDLTRKGAWITREMCAACRLRRLPCLCLNSNTPAHEVDPTRTIAGFPDSAFALASRLLDPDPRSRITAAAALKHPFILQP